MKRNMAAIFVIAVMIFAATACGTKVAPNAAISNLAFGKNVTAEPALTTFDIADGIYAIAWISKAAPKHSLYFRVIAEKVAERQKGDEVMTKNVDLEGTVTAKLHFSVAYPGEYKIEATLSDDAGQKIDSKSGTIIVTGEPLPLVSEEGERDAEKEKDKDEHDHRERDRDRGKDKDRK